MSSGSDRIQFIDLLRGIAVIAMVFGHTFDAVLDVGSRSSGWFQVYTFFRGFTAPVFLFVSGLAFSVATEKRWEEYIRWSPYLARRLRRVLLLLGIGYALHLPFFSLEKIMTQATAEEVERFLQADVLQCIAVCLLFLHVLIVLVRTPGTFVLAVSVCTLAVTGLTPVAWSVDWSGFLPGFATPYMNGNGFSPFPLFPYAGFLFFGIIIGHTIVRDHGSVHRYRFATRLAQLSAAFAVAGILIDQVPVTLYPIVDFWKAHPVVFLLKLSGVLQLVMFAFLLRGIPERFGHHLSMLGQSSFFIYAMHIVFVYGSTVNDGLSTLVGPVVHPFPATLLAAGMVLLMAFLVRSWNSLYRHNTRVAVYGRAALASAFLLLFLIRTY